ncbi:MAG: sigma-70 family RNA polymerase sigma factor [Gemmataceae bacterium]|nr:sigma-70 family RNA polymerase sigma factor [Gemmataceae bacterium]
MAKTLDDILVYLLRSDALRHSEGVPDGDLLGRFIERRDEVAWDALVRRHGPMVWGVCRRILGHTQDAEDAFQTTFVVLVRRAASISPRGGVGNWLYGVARQTAVKARATAARRGARERQVAVLPEPGVTDPPPDDLRPVLDRELGRLPDKYRAPIVLCDLGGKTFKDAARELGWPEGTLSGRLSRARKLLADRLTRAGAVPPAGVAVLGVGEAAGGDVPPPLVTSAITAGWRVAAGQPMSGLAPAVATLTEEVLRAMFIPKLKLVAGVLLVGTMTLTGVAISARHSGSAPDEPKKANPPEPPKAANAPQDPPPRGQPGGNAKIRELQQERLALLQQLADWMTEAYKGGQVPLTTVLEAQREVNAAELELCETHQERLAVLERKAELAKEIEKNTEKSVQAHSVPRANLLKARANRLQAEIELEKEKAARPK